VMYEMETAANRAICARPCNKDAACQAGQACTGHAAKTPGAGFASNVVDVCAPR
jgi:hypothetical protein